MTGIEHGAIVLSEPCLPSPGLVPGKHFATADIAEMAEQLDQLLSSPRGEEFAASARQLAASELRSAFDLRTELRALSFLHEVTFRG